jgi:hypothetical protein
MNPLLSIVIPTIDGREEWLEQTCKAYYARTTVEFEIIVEENHPACGPAWQAGGEKAVGQYIFMSADDLEPQREGWEHCAMNACDRNTLPAPRIFHTDGRLQSCGESWEMLEPDGEETGFTRAPFMSRAQWEIAQPMLPVHYATDNWVSWRCWREGIPTVVTYGFDLIHHLAPEGRDEGRMGADLEILRRATEGEDVWHES